MPSGDLTERLRRAFADELSEGAARADRLLLAIEREREEAPRRAMVTEMAGVVHGLKGAARAAGVPAVERACHDLEGVLGPIAAGTCEPTAEVIELLLRSFDALREAGRLLRENGDPAAPFRELSPAWAALGAAPVAPIAPATPIAPVTPAAPASPEAFAAPASVPSGAAAGEPRPSAAVPANADALQAGFVPSGPPADATLRVSAGRIDRVLALAGELRAVRARLDRRQDDLSRMRDLVAQWLAAWRDAGRVEGALGAHPAAQLLHGGKDRLLRLERVIGQMAADLEADRRALRQTAVLLESEANRLRTVPFARGCEGLERAARDVARARGKEVALVIEGGAIELDRVLLGAAARSTSASPTTGRGSTSRRSAGAPPSLASRTSPGATTSSRGSLYARASRRRST